MFPFNVTPSNAGGGGVGGRQRGAFLFYKPGKVGSDLAFAFVIIEGENKTPLYFCSPFLSAKS